MDRQTDYGNQCLMDPPVRGGHTKEQHSIRTIQTSSEAVCSLASNNRPTGLRHYVTVHLFMLRVGPCTILWHFEVRHDSCIFPLIDKKLSYRKQITRQLRTQLRRGHSNSHAWGADQHTLLHLYKSLVRSKLDYGCIVYGSARNSYLRMLDPVQNHVLCLCLGTYRTSPSPSLCVLAYEQLSLLFTSDAV